MKTESLVLSRLNRSHKHLIAACRTDLSRKGRRLFSLRANSEIRGSAAAHLMSEEWQAGKRVTQTSDVRVKLLGRRLKSVVEMLRGESVMPGAEG